MHRLRTVAVLAAVGLGLSACSGGRPVTSRSVTPRPSASDSRTSSPGSPAISGPTTRIRIGTFTQEFGPPLHSTSSQAPVIASFMTAEVLWIKSLFAGHALPQMKQYVVGAAFLHFFTAAHADNAAGMQPAGRDLIFDIRVTGMAKSEATLASCDYDAHYASVYRSTGKVVPGSGPLPTQDYLFETWHMVRQQKHWALSAFTVSSLPNPAARQCQPQAG